MVDVGALHALLGTLAVLGWLCAWSFSKEVFRLQLDLFNAARGCYPRVQRPSQSAEVYDWSKDGL